MLTDVARKLSNDSALGLKVTPLDWAQLPGGFVAHLRILARTAIYISGPGTGLVYHPLLGDGSVVVNIGAHQVACGKSFPLFMETNLAAAAWYYQSALYYNSTIRYRGVAEAEVVRLLLAARRLAVDSATNAALNLKRAAEGSLLVNLGRANLNPEAQLLHDLCMMSSDRPCTEMLTVFNTAAAYTEPCGGVRVWVETIVYEVCYFSEKGVMHVSKRSGDLASVNSDTTASVIKKVHCQSPRSKLQALKLAFGPSLLASTSHPRKNTV